MACGWVGRQRGRPQSSSALSPSVTLGRRCEPIAGGLTRDGIPTAQGGQAWHASTVRKVLASQQADAVLKHLATQLEPDPVGMNDSTAQRMVCGGVNS
jgi:hypothetical protein